MEPAQGLRPWREVAPPHPALGGHLDADFAADLAEVRAGRAAPEYGDPVEFFARTFLTAGLRQLLRGAARRVGGGGGEPVAVLRTPFGGGKTHALLALYHLLGGAAGRLPGAGPLLGDSAPPPARVAVLAGTDLSPGRPWPCAALGGRPVRTLWGELAAQLGGAEAYARFAAEDDAALPPGAGALLQLLDSQGPCVVLIDELVAFLRVLFGRRGSTAGSFDANLTFLQNLTEAVRRSGRGLLVATLPSSPAQLGGEGGAEAAARLQATFGRVEAAATPVAAGEGGAVVRQRLLRPAADAEAREAACGAFTALYAAHPGHFPAECRGAEYGERLRAGYPIHPEVFDRLDGDWAALDAFQGRRGVLRFLAAAVHELSRRGDGAPLILAGGLPLDAPRVREALTACLPRGWGDVVERDVDGEASAPVAIERWEARFRRGQVARRLARTIFLGAAATGPPGLELVRARLGAMGPRESPAVFDDALGRLRERLDHLRADGGHLWFELLPNLRRVAADRAAGLPETRGQEEVALRLRAWARQRDRAATAALRGVHAPEPGALIPDDAAVRLAILPLSAGHHARADGSPALQRAAELLAGHPRHANMLVCLAADGRESGAILAAARECAGWRSIAADEAEPLHPDGPRAREAALGLARAEATLAERLEAAYRWLLVPAQDLAGARWEAIALTGEGDPVSRAARRLQADQLLLTRCAPALLRLELDRWLWRDAPDIALAELWRCLTSYPYLPRLAEEGVLAAAVAEGVAAGVFAYAEGAEAGGRYLGLRLGDAGPRLRLDGGALLVRPEVARAQLPAGAPPAAGAEPLAPAGAPTRFSGSAPLDPARAGRDAARVAEEVLAQLTALGGAEAEVTLHVSVRVPAGVPLEVVRAVRENARALRFRSAEFGECAQAAGEHERPADSLGRCSALFPSPPDDT